MMANARNWRALAVVALVTALITACGATATPAPGAAAVSNHGAARMSSRPAAQPPTPASLRLDWAVSGYHAPFYLALEDGYYKQQGIDLTIGAGNGSGNVVQTIGNGRDTFGLVDGGIMMAEIAKGLKVQMVMGILQKSPMSLVCTTKSGIRTPGQLVGKSISATPGDANYVFLPAFLKAVGLRISQVRLLMGSAQARTEAVLSGRADCMAAFDFNNVAPLEAQGVPVRTFDYADHGVNLPSLGIVVSDATAKNDSSLITRFLRATIAGFQAAQRDPAAAIAALVKANPNLNIERKVYQQVLTASFQLFKTSATAGHPFGWMAPQDWMAAQELLDRYEGVKPVANVGTFFTDRFLPAS